MDPGLCIFIHKEQLLIPLLRGEKTFEDANEVFVFQMKHVFP